jgi:hypothetical protein
MELLEFMEVKGCKEIEGLKTNRAASDVSRYRTHSAIGIFLASVYFLFLLYLIYLLARGL